MALTKSEAKLKRENPEKFRKLQEMRKRRRGKRQLAKPAKRTIRTLSPASPVKVTPIGNVKRGSMKPGLDAAAAAAKKRDAAKAAKRSAPKPPKKFKSNVARGTMKPGLDAVAAEDPAANVGPGKTIRTNPKGEGSLTGLSMKELMSKIEDAEFPTDPDDPSAYDIEDLKADLKQLKGLKKGGSVKKKVRKKKTAVKKRAALRGYGKALRGF